MDVILPCLLGLTVVLRHGEVVAGTRANLTGLRVVEGRYRSEGRVEVRLNGQKWWGSYCTIDDRDLLHGAGRALCRQLGYPALLEASNTAQFGQATGPIWLQEVNCGYTLHPLQECYLHRWMPSWGGCDHMDDVGIRCFTGKVRLVGGKQENAGKVELQIGDDEWVSVAHGKVQGRELASDLVCRYLGYPFAIGATPEKADNDTGRFIHALQACDWETLDNRRALFDCIDEYLLTLYQNQGRQSTALLGVVCATENEILPNTSTPEFRLNPLGTGLNESRHLGFLEGRYNGSEWRTICVHKLDMCPGVIFRGLANLACRDIGYPRAENRRDIRYSQASYKGTGNDLVLRYTYLRETHTNGKRWLFGQNSCQDHDYNLILVECDTGVTMYGLTVYPCPSESCQGRCGSLASERQCGCDALCMLCNDCCYDYYKWCPSNLSNVSKELWLAASSHELLSCVVVGDKRAVIIRGCPREWQDKEETPPCVNDSRLVQVAYRDTTFVRMYCALCLYKNTVIINTVLAEHQSSADILNSDSSDEDYNFNSSDTTHATQDERLNFTYTSYDVGIDNCSAPDIRVEIQTGCRAYSAPIVAPDGLVYKNPHCAHCNGMHLFALDYSPCRDSLVCSGVKSTRLFTRTVHIYTPETSNDFSLLREAYCFDKQYALLVQSPILNPPEKEQNTSSLPQPSGVMMCYLFLLSQQNVQLTWPFYLAAIKGREVSGFEKGASGVSTSYLGNVTDFEALLDESALDQINGTRKWVVRCGITRVDFVETCGLIVGSIEPCEDSLYTTKAEILTTFNFSGIQVVYVGGGLLVESKWVSFNRSYRYQPKLSKTSAKDTGRPIEVCGEPYVNEECQIPLTQSTRLLTMGGAPAVEYKRKVFFKDHVVYLPDDRILICDIVFAKRDPLQTFNCVAFSVSATTIFATFITYCAFPVLRNVPGRAIMSLSAAMTAAQLLTIITFGKTEPEAFCLTVAPVMHLLWLSTFTWTNVLAFDLARTFSSKQARRPGRYVFSVYSLYGWGVPLLIVATCLAVHFADSGGIDFRYGMGPGEDSCWLSGKHAVVIAFVAPIACCLVANIIMFAWTVRSVHASLVAAALVHTRQSKAKEKIREFGIYLKISGVMGFTWIFGCLANRINHEVLWYLFVVLNSLQGVFIFLSFGCNRRIRDLWREKLGLKPQSGTSSDAKTKKSSENVRVKSSDQSASNV
ncbi:uncharacterized protein LOC110990104 [Acanthaster planci]|uniref:Uncharacterized protein LOC110990104 n=1 Tax=Acanthaster planci TaxID=133434 RepID=A0A8B7ZZU6_ACAPL|nr:uncharacterized protein LOC110990104 [Acanthaster planci]